MAVASFSPHGLDVVQGTETITLSRRGDDNVSIDGTKRRALGLAEAAKSDGQYTTNDIRWHIPVDNLADPPRLGDVLIDAGSDRFTVLDVQLATIKTRWRLITRNVRIVHRLNARVTILFATYEKGTGGAAEPVWHTQKAGVWARIEPNTENLGVENNARRTVKSVLIFVETDEEIDHTNRVQSADGIVYKITSYTGAERIGELATIQAEVTPWPLN